MRKIALWLVAASLCLLAVRVFADTLEQLSLEKVAKDDQQCTDADHDCECEIDEHFKRDQSTVHHGVLLVAQRMREDAEFEAFIQEIERSFTQRRPAILN